MSGKPPKPKRYDNREKNAIQIEINALRRDRSKLIKGKNDLYMARPKVKLTPEQSREHINKRREMLETYDENIRKLDKQIEEKEKEHAQFQEKLEKEGIANVYTRRNRGGRKNKSRRRI